MIILIILAFVLIAAMQIPLMVRKKQKKELVFYILFLFLGFTMTLLYALGVMLPNPVTGVRNLLDLMHVHY